MQLLCQVIYPFFLEQHLIGRVLQRLLHIRQRVKLQKFAGLG